MLPARPHPAPAPARSVRRERAIALGVAALLVLARSAPFAFFEQIQFDSDQAVFGLMAKHLAEGRAFPLFMYGQPYLLAVDSWLAAPWFLFAPASLVTLSLSLALMNAAVAVLLVIGLERWGSLRPLLALIAALFFVMPPPIVSQDLMSISGGNVAPFFYVCVLWFLRDRPFWFGPVLGIGFLHREFTIYAVPVLLAADLWHGRLFQPAVVRRWLLASVAALATWESLVALQPWADMLGPGTRGQLLGGFAASPFGNLAGRAHVAPSQVAGHARDMLLVYLPRLFAAATYQEHVPAIRYWLAWPLAAAAVLAIVRTGALCWQEARSAHATVSTGFAWYVMGVGALAALAFVATHPINEEFARYGLLVIFVPVGIAAALLALEPRAWVRGAVVCAAIGWALVPAADTVQLVARYAGSNRPSELRILADALVARGIHVASAPYWTAYAVTFMTDERVRVAATDHIRIDEYQRLAAAQPGLVQIREQPCAGGEQVSRWYLCRE